MVVETPVADSIKAASSAKNMYVQGNSLLVEIFEIDQLT